MNRAYFEALMAQHDLSMRGLAKRMGTTHAKLSLAFSGQRKINLKEATALSSIFSVPLQTIVDEAGMGVARASWVNVAGGLGAEGDVTPTPEGQIERTHTAEMPWTDAIALQCRTADSPLAWMDGWVLFCREDQHQPATQIGRFCWVECEQGIQSVGTLRRGYRPETFSLSGPSSRVDLHLRWARPILHIRT